MNEIVPVAERKTEENKDPLRKGGKNIIRFLIHCLGLNRVK
jgi:hypothetical protein